MNYIGLYFLIGVTVFFAMFLTSKEAGSITRNLLSTACRHNQSWQAWANRIFEDFVGFLLAAILMILVWPYLLYLHYKKRRFNSPDEIAKRKKAEELQLNVGNLGQRMALAEIELFEKVVDPLGAAPEEPFGHLHPVWERFKANIQAQDEIWTFTANWDHGWSAEKCNGYAILRGHEVPHHFITGRERIQIQGESAAPADLSLLVKRRRLK